jgi:hypothetical protein
MFDGLNRAYGDDPFAQIAVVTHQNDIRRRNNFQLSAREPIHANARLLEKDPA